MHEICVGMGYCGSVIDGEPRHVTMYIPESGRVAADQFVKWVFLAEGLDPFGSSHANQMRKAFVEFMGNEIVDAETLRYSVVRNQSGSS